MAVFGSRRNALQQVLSSAWSSPESKDRLLKQLRDSAPASKDVIPLVWHRDPEARDVGAELFLERADEAAVASFIRDLRGRPPQMRAYSTRILGRVPSDVVRRSLDPMIASSNGELRRYAWDLALATEGATSRWYQRKALFEAPHAIRLKVVEEFIREREPENIVKQLLELAEDMEPEISRLALEALAGVREPRVLERMMSLLTTGDETSKGVALDYLRREARTDPDGTRDQMRPLLLGREPGLRKTAVQILLETDEHEKVVLGLLEMCHKLLGWIRKRVLEAMQSCGEPVLVATLRLLEHPDAGVRSLGMMMSETFEDPRLVEPLCRLLKDPDWWIRVAACDQLGRLEDKRALPFLVDALSDEDTRWAAAEALANLKDPKALRPLTDLLSVPRPEVRLEVLRAYSYFTDRRLLPLLKRVVDQDSNPEVRERALEVGREMALRLNVDGGLFDGDLASIDRLTSPLNRLLATGRHMGASDVHVSAGEPPLARIDGVLSRIDDRESLSAAETGAMILGALSERDRKILETRREVDFCHEIPYFGRFRGSAFFQRVGLCATFRVIPEKPPTFEQIGLPGVLREILDYHLGLVVIAGPAGSGKSTTLGALVNLLNEQKAVHIISLEDPVEFVHPAKSALVNQREVGRHTLSFQSGLRAALREDPDVMMIGELRDHETIRMALEAAETGHLVLATLHTHTVMQTVDRLVDSFPTQEQSQVRTVLAKTLKFAVCQRLLPRKDGQGRVAVFEILKGTLGVGNLIRKGDTLQIPGQLQIGRSVGMQSFDHALSELLEHDVISKMTAHRYADKKENFEVGPRRAKPPRREGGLR